MKTLLVLCSLLLGYSIASAQRYTYDVAGRLTSATYKNGVHIAYTYDANGNITNKKKTVVSSVNNEYGSSQELLLFPNPTVDKVCITLPEKLLGREIQLEIFSATGNSVYQAVYPAHEFSGEVSMKNYPKGVYTFRIVSSTLHYTGRCIIQ